MVPELACPDHQAATTRLVREAICRNFGRPPEDDAPSRTHWPSQTGAHKGWRLIDTGAGRPGGCGPLLVDVLCKARFVNAEAALRGIAARERVGNHADTR